MEVMDEPPDNIVYDFYLYQNYPNPFNPTTKIKYNLRRSENVTLKVYDVLGSEIEVLVNHPQEPGVYEVKFDGSSLPSGVYTYVLSQGAFRDAKKMLILR